jgi:flagellar hook-length control protein FliK
VARIGAALSSPARTRADQTPAEQQPETTSVHVVSQQSWLPPVDPRLSGGSQSHPSSGENPGSAPGENAPGEKGQGAEPLPSFAQTAPANFSAAALPSAPSGGVQASASSASTQLRDLPSAPTPAVRRDLEITLTPQDLGGLQVKLKSAGDRLELSFVAERGETARMISDKSAALENQLHDAGLGLGGVAISSSAAGSMTGDAPSGGGPSGQGPSAQTSGSAFGAAGGQGESESTRHRQNSSGRQSQDKVNEPSDASRDPRGSAGDRGLYL